MSTAGSRRVTVDMADPADAEARAMALAVIAIRLMRHSGAPAPEAGACFDLIYAAARIAHHEIQLTEAELVRALRKAAEFAARVVCTRDPDGTAAPPRWRNALH